MFKQGVSFPGIVQSHRSIRELEIPAIEKVDSVSKVQSGHPSLHPPVGVQAEKEVGRRSRAPLDSSSMMVTGFLPWSLGFIRRRFQFDTNTLR